MLEVVDVEHGDGKWSAAAEGAAEFAGHDFHEVSTVEEAGEWVSKGLFSEGLAEVEIGEREPDDVCKGVEQLAGCIFEDGAGIEDEGDDAFCFSVDVEREAEGGIRARGVEAAAGKGVGSRGDPMREVRGHDEAVLGREDGDGRGIAPGGNRCEQGGIGIEDGEEAGCRGKEESCLLGDDGVGVIDGVAGLEHVTEPGNGGEVGFALTKLGEGVLLFDFHADEVGEALVIFAADEDHDDEEDEEQAARGGCKEMALNEEGKDHGRRRGAYK